jgi:hypothetical protein
LEHFQYHYQRLFVWEFPNDPPAMLLNCWNIRLIIVRAPDTRGLLINVTRVAIVGQAVALPLFDTMVVLGQERVVRRLRAALVEWK